MVWRGAIFSVGTPVAKGRSSNDNTILNTGEKL
jgi:hypothetical protein